MNSFLVEEYNTLKIKYKIGRIIVDYVFVHLHNITGQMHFLNIYLI